MAVKYKLIQKKDFSKDAPKDGKKYYASIVSNGTVDLEELCESISEETALTSADVKSCLDRLPRIIARHLREGRNVQLGELGNIRLSLGSKGSDTMRAFNAATMMKKPNILFTPAVVCATRRRAWSTAASGWRATRIVVAIARARARSKGSPGLSSETRGNTPLRAAAALLRDLPRHSGETCGSSRRRPAAALGGVPPRLFAGA